MHRPPAGLNVPVGDGVKQIICQPLQESSHGRDEHKPLSEQQVYLFQWFLATENGADFSIQISQMYNVQSSMFFAGLLAVPDNTCRRHTPDSRRQEQYSIGKQGKVVHTLRFCSKFPYGVFGKSACWGVSPIPTEHTINCVATPPGEA